MEKNKPVKLEDIAGELGISIVTVSNALNGKRGVGKELRQRVLDKAAEMGYKPRRPSVKRETRSYSIGVMIAERYIKGFPSFYMEVYRLFAQISARKGVLTLLEIVDRNKEELNYPAAFFSGMKIDGIAFLGEMDIDFIRSVRNEQNVPAVGIDFYDMEEKMDYIITDSLHGMEQVTQKLIDAGHRRIDFLGNPYSTKSIMDRYMGFCKALFENGISEDMVRVIPDRDEKQTGSGISFELPDELPEAFAVNCDKAASILIHKLRRRGLRVPEDISVVSFDNLKIDNTDDIVLTTYESDGKALAHAGLSRLLKKIEGKEKKGEEGEIFIVEGRLVEGNTVAHAKGDTL